MVNRTFRIFLDQAVALRRRRLCHSARPLSPFPRTAWPALTASRRLHEEQALGPDVDIEIEACDECNTVINAKAVTRRRKSAGGGFVGLVASSRISFPAPLILPASSGRRA